MIHRQESLAQKVDADFRSRYQARTDFNLEVVESLAPELWLSNQAGITSRVVLEKSVNRVNLNTARRFELFWFLMSNYHDVLEAKSERKSPAKSTIGEFLRSFAVEAKTRASLLGGVRVDAALATADLIITARESAPNHSLRSLQDLKTVLSPEWYSAVEKASIR